MNEIIYPLSQTQRVCQQQVNKVVYYAPKFQPHAQIFKERKENILAWYCSSQFLKAKIEQVFQFTSICRVNYYMRMFVMDSLNERENEYIRYNNSPFLQGINETIQNQYYVRNQIAEQNPKLQAAKQYILDHVRVADFECLFDTMVLRGDAEDIIDAMEEISKNQIFTRQIHFEQNDEHEYYEINWPNENQYPHCTAGWLVTEFEKAVYLRYYQFLGENRCYTKSTEILTPQLILERINSSGIQLDLDIQPAIKQDSKFFSEENILKSWAIYIENKRVPLDLAFCEQLMKDIDQVLYVPLKLISNINILQCKKFISDQLFKQCPLKPLPQFESKDFGEKSRQIKPSGKKGTIKSENNLQEVHNIFSNSTVQSNVLPKPVDQIVKTSVKAKELLGQPVQNNGRLFSTETQEHQEQMQGVALQAYQNILKNVLEDYEQHKRFKKEQQRKAKKKAAAMKTLTSETTSNCTDNQSNHQPALHDFIDPPLKSKNHKKKQELKKRKQEKEEKQKKKEEMQQQSEVPVVGTYEQEAKEDSLQVETVQTAETIEVTTQPETAVVEDTAQDDSGFSEVVSKRKLKLNQRIQQESREISEKKDRGAKKSTKNRRNNNFQDDSSLRDMPTHTIQLKKQTSHQSVQINKQYLLEDNSKKQECKRPNQNKFKKGGLVKAPQSQSQAPQMQFDYSNVDTKELERIYQNIVLAKLNKDITEIYEKQKALYNKYRNARQISILRVQNVVKLFFKALNAQAIVYGSSATGLALEDSDVDIVITGLMVYSRQQLYEPMKKLCEVFNELKWIVLCKPIFSANIPVIKLEVDPSIAYLQFNGAEQFFLMNRKNPDELNIRKDDPCKNIQIDLTFGLQPMLNYITQEMNHPHIGFSTTDYTKELVDKIQGFAQVTIILKKILRMKNLNDSYTGGLSSFCLILMIQAVATKESSIGELFYRFVHKYGTQFDPIKWGILLDSNGGSQNFINIESSIQTQPLTIFSPVTWQPIQINVYQIQNILQLFREIYIEIKQHQSYIGAFLQKSISVESLTELSTKNDYRKLAEMVNWQSQNLLECFL